MGGFARIFMISCKQKYLVYLVLYLLGYNLSDKETYKTAENIPFNRVAVFGPKRTSHWTKQGSASKWYRSNFLIPHYFELGFQKPLNSPKIKIQTEERSTVTSYTVAVKQRALISRVASFFLKKCFGSTTMPPHPQQCGLNLRERCLITKRLLLFSSC